MTPISKRLVAALAFVAAGTFATGLAFAGEDTAKPASPETKASAPADAPKTAEKTTEAPATKTPSPLHSVLGYLSKQIAPELECACPAKPEGEKAWRGWFAGGANVPMAALRDRLVADGWTADAFVGFFQKMSKKGCGDCSKGDCSKGDCSKGDCSKGDCAKGECKGGCKGCKGEDKAGETAKPDAAAKPVEAPAKP